nr:histidine ammonia-lyase [Saprospiraceae bacterium]
MNTTHFEFGNKKTSTESIYNTVRKNSELKLGEGSRQAIEKCRHFLESEVKSGKTIYGINTGFGHLCDIRIGEDKLGQLQENLIRSHACGSGDWVPDEVSRTILLLKIKNLSLGYSGVRMELVDRLQTIYNSGVIPMIYEQGSLGASGDLAPLAHLSLLLLGEGKVKFRDEIMPTSRFLSLSGIAPLDLASKEGLALINGTQFSTGYGVQAVVKAGLLHRLANLCAVLSLEAFNCRIDPFSPLVHQIRPHKGQTVVSEEINQWISGSDLKDRKKISVQDPYSFRCIPQVHGAAYDLIQTVRNTIETEINSVSDNPLVFPDQGRIISAGNFHAEPIAFAMDHLALGLCELGSISERRIYQLINGHRGLPVCLTRDAGIQSGFMILQYSAAASVSLNKQLATPASVDSIISSMGQEDHVSMAANAATKTYRILQNTFTVLAMEFMTAVQALTLSETKGLSPQVTEIIHSYRKIVPQLETDRNLSEDVEKTKLFLKDLLERWADEF